MRFIRTLPGPTCYTRTMTSPDPTLILVNDS
jgi:hypothetical protein